MRTAILERARRAFGQAHSSPQSRGVIVMAASLLAATHLVASPVVNTLGGGNPHVNPKYLGYSDGTTLSQALFHTPYGLAMDSTGQYLFVADRDNNLIRYLDLKAGWTWTFDIAATNLIKKPIAVALDNSNNVYVLNRGTTNNVSTNGTVVEFDNWGDAVATNAVKLTNAAGMALDGDGNIYLTVQSNRLIRIDAGTTNRTTIATNFPAGTSLQGIVVKHNGLIAACDAGRNGIYLIDPATGNVTTNAGFHGAGDFTTNGNNIASSLNAKFNRPMNLAEVGDGNLIVTDYGNNRVKLVLANGVVTNLYGVTLKYWGGTYPGWYDGTVQVPDSMTPNVQSRSPVGVVYASDGTIYTTEDYYHTIRKATGAGLPLVPPPPPPPPPPPVPATPIIGQVTFPAPNDWSVLIPITSFVFNNDIMLAIKGTNGTQAFYTYGVTGTVIPNPSPTNGTQAPYYADMLYLGTVQDLGVPRYPDMTIKAVDVNGDGLSSSTVSARIQFVVANPMIIGNNAALFTLSDITTNAVFYYTIDGSDPTNALGATNSFKLCTNSLSLTNVISLSINSNFTFKVRAFLDNYQPSAVVPAFFATSNFVPNTISFGFASGEASSDFIASPGQTFYAPVTLSVLPVTTMYSLQFNLVVTNISTTPTAPIAPGTYDFVSMLVKPIPGESDLYEQIPPWMYVYNATNVPNVPWPGMDGSTNFVSLLIDSPNNNLLAVGWVERYSKTNLYDTKSQDLIQYSMAHDDVFLQANGQIILGGFNFTVPRNADPSQVYQIQIGRPSATSDGIGTPGSSVFVYASTNGSLAGGALNSIKNVTIGQRKYIVGNVYPFRWFNAGDFGNTNLQSADVVQVFQSAVYGLNYPPLGSDFFDAMDSCGSIGTLDGQTGYYTNNYNFPYGFPYTITNYTYTYDTNDTLISASTNSVDLNAEIYIDTAFFTAMYYITNIYNNPLGNGVTVQTLPGVTYHFSNPYVPNLYDYGDQQINQIIFGDGILDVCDVYITYRRSLEESNTTYWYQRFWTNGVRVAELVPNVFNPKLVAQKSSLVGKITQQTANTSVTNQPKVNFAAGDFQATAGSTIQIPITASIFGDYPLRVLMLNLTVVPLDGSPALTTPVSFSYNAALGSPWTTDQKGNGNYSAAWLNSGISGLTGNVAIGTLTVTIPTNAASLSAYAVHFDHASASPNGLVSFPKQARTGLITFSSRTNSSWGDGIPDAWRLRYFLTLNNMLSATNADGDGDGMNNLQEYLAGTDPTDPKSYFKNIGTDPAAAQQPQDCVISWPSAIGKQYVIQRSPSLSTPIWTSVGTNSGNGTTMEYHDLSGGGIRYYRVFVQ